MIDVNEIFQWLNDEEAAELKRAAYFHTDASRNPNSLWGRDNEDTPEAECISSQELMRQCEQTLDRLRKVALRRSVLATAV